MHSSDKSFILPSVAGNKDNQLHTLTIVVTGNARTHIDTHTHTTHTHTHLTARLMVSMASPAVTTAVRT